MGSTPSTSSLSPGDPTQQQQAQFQNRILNVSEMAEAERTADLVRVIESPSYGNLKLMQYRSQKTNFAVIEKLTQDPKEFSRQLNEVTARLCLPDPPASLIRLFLAFKSHESEYCSQFYRIYMSIEYIPQTLEDQITFRKTRNSHCGEKEILAMIFSVASAIGYMHTQGIAHGCIQPKTILYHPTDFAYKITDIQFFTQRGHHASEYQQYLLMVDSISPDSCYLSPELLSALSHRQAVPKHNPSKSEVFALGLTAIEMATMKSMQPIFDFSSFSINQKLLNTFFTEINKIYSKSFTGILQAMLTLDDALRPDIPELLDLLRNSESFQLTSKYNPLVASILSESHLQHYSSSSKNSLNLSAQNKFSRKYESTTALLNNRNDSLKSSQQQQQQPKQQQYQPPSPRKSATNIMPAQKQKDTFETNFSIPSESGVIISSDLASASINNNLNFISPDTKIINNNSNFNYNTYSYLRHSSSSKHRISPPRLSQHEASQSQSNIPPPTKQPSRQSSPPQKTTNLSITALKAEQRSAKKLTPQDPNRIPKPLQSPTKQRSISQIPTKLNQQYSSVSIPPKVFVSQSPLVSTRENNNPIATSNPSSQKLQSLLPTRDQQQQHNQQNQNYSSHNHYKSNHNNSYSAFSSTTYKPFMSSQTEDLLKSYQHNISTNKLSTTNQPFVKSPTRAPHIQSKSPFRSIYNPVASPKTLAATMAIASVTPLRDKSGTENVRNNNNNNYFSTNNYESNFQSNNPSKQDMSMLSNYEIQDIHIQPTAAMQLDTRKKNDQQSTTQQHPVVVEENVSKALDLLQARIDRLDQSLSQTHTRHKHKPSLALQSSIPAPPAATRSASNHPYLHNTKASTQDYNYLQLPNNSDYSLYTKPTNNFRSNLSNNSRTNHYQS